MEKIEIEMIVAYGKNRVIGNTILNKMPPWYLPLDLKNFTAETEGHIVIMGRKTYDSLPVGYQPLPNRVNIVITRDMLYVPANRNDQTFTVYSPEEALKLAVLMSAGRKIFIAGGGYIYREMLYHPMVKVVRIVATEVDGVFEGDVYFPKLPATEFTSINVRLFIKKEGGKTTHDFAITEYVPAA